jgi:hypothetical protein
MSAWIIPTLAVLGVTAAVIAFVRTPRERRYRGFSPTTLEEQLKNCSESAQAVIIRGNKKQAFARAAPFILVGIALGYFAWWIGNTNNPECVRLLGVNATYLSLLIFCYGFPVIFLAMSILFLGVGIKTLKTGYFPPLDAVVFSDTIAKKGTVSRIRGIVLVMLPAFASLGVHLGNSAFTAVAGDRSMHEIVEKLEAKCQ